MLEIRHLCPVGAATGAVWVSEGAVVQANEITHSPMVLDGSICDDDSSVYNSFHSSLGHMIYHYHKERATLLDHLEVGKGVEVQSEQTKKESEAQAGQTEVVDVEDEAEGGCQCLDVFGYGFVM
ncbi:hypothetical protein VNO78_10453 [Psophocarpus tetragonolobus]|uniref:Uncharacterized protein n=1 Tax=Psophocarpus tetragonolobus TaxID=3891 RepID=A0AAN9SKR7_PSOTE